MRTAFMAALHDLAERDPRVTLIVGDLGFSVIERFAESHPDQFVNAGVAEQDMIGLATGMALSGRIVFAYSIGNFATLRCLEQIRNDACYHRANVNIVSVGAGLAYGSLGSSHHATEDLAILRALPEMTVVSPGDPIEAGLATQAVAALEGPAYLRLGKAGERVLHNDVPAFSLGKAIELCHGDDVSIIATGSVLGLALDAAGHLRSQGIHTRVLSMHTITPIDRQAIVAAVSECRVVITLEEHSVIGGLGSAVAEIVAELPNGHAQFRRVGLPRAFSRAVGSHEFLKRQNGLDITELCNLLGRMYLESGANNDASVPA